MKFLFAFSSFDPAVIHLSSEHASADEAIKKAGSIIKEMTRRNGEIDRCVISDKRGNMVAKVNYSA